MKTTNLIVFGSRSFRDYTLLADNLDCLKFSSIISGGAMGADRLAAVYADRNSIPLVEFKPDYLRYGRVAPLVRNSQMAKLGDVFICFWDGKSRGTADMIRKIDGLGKPVKIVKF